MNISGYYSDINNNRIDVVFSLDSGLEDIEISEDSPLRFAGDAVTIEENIDDVFDEMITKTATINLITDNYIGDLLFARSPKEIGLMITKTYKVDDQERQVILFDGYVSPAAYNQPFVQPHDSFTITGVDKLSVLQYYYYKNIYSLSDYDNYKSGAGLVSFKEMLDDVFGEDNWDWDESKDVDLSKMFLSEGEILGESFDDLWKKDEVLIQICRYLSLHVRQQGTRFYLFSWRTQAMSEVLNDVNIRNVAGTDMDLTIDDVYNQIQVKDDVTPVEDVFSAPLEDEDLFSVYSSSQQFLTEYISDGNGDSSKNFMDKMLGRETGSISEQDDRYNDCLPHRNEWYVQIKQSPNWELYTYSGDNVSTLFELEGNKGINQHNIMKYMRQHEFTPMIMSLGKNEIKGTDSSTLKKPGMSNFLVISVNGDCSNKENDVNYYDNKLQQLAGPQSKGLAQYTGFSAANFKPTDAGSTNYLVFNGKITLAPMAWQSNVTSLYPDLPAPVYNYTDNVTWNATNFSWKAVAPSDRNGNGRYYYQRFHTKKYPNAGNSQMGNADNDLFLYPNVDVKDYVDEAPYQTNKYGSPWRYEYTKEEQAVSDQTDNIDKLPVLACRLTIGDDEDMMYLVEKYDGNGKSIYNWYRKNNLPVRDGVTIDYFTLGVDPNAGDIIIGQEFDIQDNTGEYGIDATGTAIPIRYDDDLPLAGTVKFTILGPVNIVWDGVIRKHPSFWRHTSYFTSGPMQVLSYVSNIFIQDFTCKIYTDNGFADNKGDSDIYYVSDMNNGAHDYVAGKHETEFKIITQLTTEECMLMDVKNTVNVNAVLDDNKNTINEIKDDNLYELLISSGESEETAEREATAKAEEHYVKEYYDLCSSPKIIATVTVKDLIDFDYNTKYTIPAMSKQFILLSKSQDLKYDTANIKLREI